MSYWIVGISTVLSLAGTATTVISQRQAASDAEDVAAANAARDKLSAQQEQEAAAENARRKEEDAGKYLAAQRAALAANGLAMEGTPLAVLGDDASDLQRDIVDIGYQADVRTRAILAGAAIGTAEASNTADALRTGSIATGLQGVSSAAYSYGTATGKIAPKTKSYLG